MKEIKYLRGPREKHFKKSDGSMVCYLYDRDVHYLKNKKYVEIDNRVVENNKSFKAKASRINPVFKKERKGVEINEGKHSFYMEMASSKTNNDDIWYLDNKINYRNILETIDLNYLIENDKLKEEIILKEYNKSLKEISFKVDTNYELKLNDDKSISIIDKEKIKYVIEAPFMIDSNGNYNNNIYYKLDFNNNKYTIKLILDTDWLGKNNIKYPVIIDPTISENSSNSIIDTYIYKGDTNVSRGSSNILKVGTDSSKKVYRSLIKFNLPKLGTGSMVISAKMNLVSHETDIGTLGDGRDNAIDIHTINTDWTEGSANWDNMNDKYYKRIDEYFNPQRSYYVTENNKTSLYLADNYFDITNVVRKWYAGRPNYGIMLKNHNETYDSKRLVNSFCSKNHSTTVGDVKPTIIINYRNLNGLEDYESYESQEFSNGASYVNRFNGNLTMDFTLSKSKGTKFPATLDIIYNTNDVILDNNYGCGVGYKFNLYQTIKPDQIDKQDYLRYLDADGTIHYFYKKGNSYIDEDGLGLTATLSNNDYIITDKDNNKIKFIKNNDTWYLSSITNTNNDTVTITYADNKITKITDANGKEINISYINNLIKINNGYENTTLEYDDNISKLSSISNKYGTITLTYHTYDNYNIVEKVKDISGKSITYNYYDTIPYKISSVYEVGINNSIGKKLDFSYGFDVTSIKNEKGGYRTYTFNENGNVVCLTNLKGDDTLEDALGKSSVYYNKYYNERSVNKLGVDNSLVGYVKNYIINSSFENNLTNIVSSSFIRSNECANTGNYSLKLDNTGSNSYDIYKLNIAKRGTYMLSMYIKNNEKLKIYIKHHTNDGTESILYDEVDKNDEFVKVNILFISTLDEEEITIGLECIDDVICYIDDVQFEEGDSCNQYNLIDNSDFSKNLENWKLNFTNRNGSAISSSGNYELVSTDTFGKILKIKSDPFKGYSLSKKININGKKGDVYNLSFWYKNLGIKPKMIEADAICTIMFNYTKTTDLGHCIPISSNFVINDTEWQYFSTNFFAEEDYSSIDVVVDGYCNANYLYLTNFSLYKDVENNLFDYDEEGNVTKIYKNYKVKQEFNYDKNNKLINTFEPNGNNFKFEYDNVDTNRVRSGISPTGISNEIGYDEFNNPIRTKIKNIGFDNTDSRKCFIRLKGTDKYLKLNLVSKSLYFSDDTCSIDEWLITKNNDKYLIKSVTYDNYYLKSYDNAVVGLTNSDSLYTIEDLTNGSSVISINDKYLCSNNEKLELKNKSLVTDKDNDNTIQLYLENSLNKEYIETNAVYSSDGKKLIKTIDALNNETNYDIDSDTGLVNSITDPNGTITNYTYNSKDQITMISKESIIVDYEYNDNNLVKSIKTGNKEYNFLYDEFLNQKEVSIGEQKLITNNYNVNNGNLLSSVYGNGDEISFVYDKMDRLLTTIRMDDDVGYNYNKFGLLGSVYTLEDTYNYDYDYGKRLSRYEYNNFRIDFKYNYKDLLTNRKYKLDNNKFNIEYGYDKNDYITNVNFDNNNNNNNIKYNYDLLGRLENISINDNYNKNYKYVTKGNKTSMLIEKEVIGNDEYTYKYDKLNNISEIRKNNKLFKKYKYNGLNELVHVDDYENNISVDYTYDSQGNIILKKEYEVGTKAILNKRVFRYENSAWEDQLTSYDDKEITYDAIGNPLTIGSANLTWINGRSLNSYVDNSKNLNISYKYDKDGIRKEKQVNDDVYKYYVEGNKIMLELN